MVRLIQGFFYYEWFIHQTVAEDEAKIVNPKGRRHMYLGVIFPSRSCETELVGKMFDHFGESRLFDIKITRTKMRFVKQYNLRDDTINYSFRREGKLWIGEYSGAHAGRGDTRCVIKTQNNFLMPLG